MDYQNLTPAEKRALAPLLLHKLGTQKGKHFVIEVHRKPMSFTCTGTKFLWSRGYITVEATQLRDDWRPGIHYTLQVPFLQDICTSSVATQMFAPTRISNGFKRTKEHRSSERITRTHTKPTYSVEHPATERFIKRHTKPTTLTQVINILKDTGPYEILDEPKLSRRDVEVTMKVLANVIGTLETLQREQKDG